jgi:adenosylmethionine---8-amino-7-oxononanoate aminotransferase
MASTLPSDWSDRLKLDLQHVWHPFTQMKEMELDPPIPVVGGEGCDLLLANGARVLDGISSWWTNLHGHGHPKLVAAMERQASRLDHTMFAGFTHEPALELVMRLKGWLPKNLTRCFFSDNGSTAVEVALKMSFQAQMQKGQKQRTRFGALHGGYHGDTLGAVGVGELGNFMAGIFAPLLLRCDRFEVPEDPRRNIHPDLSGWDSRLEEAREDLRSFFSQQGEQLAAFIVEPLIQGAGGMRMWPVELLQELRTQCDRHGVYLIADEVMTGFGRTGTFLAIEQSGVQADLLCLSKGLTGGTMPLSLTWATEEIYGHFWGDYDSGRAFLHGHSYTANPIACAVANASLTLFDEEPVLTRSQELGAALRAAWSDLASHKAVRGARNLGCIAACQIVDPDTNKAHPIKARIGWRLHRRALDLGLLVRPIGDCLYLLPPLSTPAKRIHGAVETLKMLLDSI